MPGCHHPRKRVTQYSRDVDDYPKDAGILDTQLSRGTTTVVVEAPRTTPSSSRWLNPN
jgi:hypothetical protein